MSLIGLLRSRATRPDRALYVYLAAVLVVGLLYGGFVLAGEAQFGFERILGWDSLFYALSAQRVTTEGIGWLFRFLSQPDLLHWDHPNAYVLILSALIFVYPDVSVSVHIIPLVMVAALSATAGLLGARISSKGVAVVAILLTGLSMATFRHFVDLHRGLFAFTLTTLLIALDSPKALSKLRLNRIGLAAIILMFVVAFSEFEIYLVYFAATALTLVLRREWNANGAAAVLWSAVPGAAFALTPAPWKMMGNLLTPGTGGPQEVIGLDIHLIYLSSIVSVPFVIAGFLFLIRDVRSRPGGLSPLLFSWSGILLVLLITLGLILREIQPYRALILLHAPLLVALGAHGMVRAFVRTVNRSTSKLPGPLPLKLRIPQQSAHVAFALLSASLITVSAIGLEQNAARFWKPVVPDDIYERLAVSAAYLDEAWNEPIYPVLNGAVIHILTPLRFEIALLNGPAYVYYGDINFLAWFVPWVDVDTSLRDSPREAHFLRQEHRELLIALDPGPLSLLSHPIIIVKPELFEREISSDLEAFRVEDGLYVIPPNALSLDTFLSWEILAFEDAFDIGDASLVQRDWSLSPEVVEIYTTGGGYEVSYPHYFPVDSSYAISVHLFDFPGTELPGTTPTSPLQLFVDEAPIETLVYGTNAVTWWNVTVPLDAGFHVITLRAADDQLPFWMSLDQIVVTAVES